MIYSTITTTQTYQLYYLNSNRAFKVPFEIVLASVFVCEVVFDVVFKINFIEGNNQNFTPKESLKYYKSITTVTTYNYSNHLLFAKDAINPFFIDRYETNYKWVTTPDSDVDSQRLHTQSTRSNTRKKNLKLT